MTQDAIPAEAFSLEKAVLDAGGIIRSADEGQIAFEWAGRPDAFILLLSGRLTVHFRAPGQSLGWAQCRVVAGQDFMPLTAAILSGRGIAVRAFCNAPCTWIELPPARFKTLVHEQSAFRSALFAAHARRLPTFFARLGTGRGISLDRRVADWLLSHARSGEVVATHVEIATELLTAREVVSRKLRDFAEKGWITQGRGCILLGAPAALARLARDGFAVRAAAFEASRRDCG